VSREVRRATAPAEMEPEAWQCLGRVGSDAPIPGPDPQGSVTAIGERASDVIREGMARPSVDDDARPAAFRVAPSTSYAPPARPPAPATDLTPSSPSSMPGPVPFSGFP
jgi:hypothetical protein